MLMEFPSALLAPNPMLYAAFWDLELLTFKYKNYVRIRKTLEAARKEHFELNSIVRSGPLAPPKTKEFRTIATLLDDVERWRNVGDIELEKKLWQIIAEKASMYADGYREKYSGDGSETKCGIVPPIFAADRTESGSHG
jgi:hypothetical protein